MDLNDEDDFIETTNNVEADHVNIETDANLTQASDINSTSGRRDG